MQRRGDLLLSILVTGALLVSVLVPYRELPDIVVCGFRWLTGMLCPLCGLTHAFSAIGHGEVAASWHFHPLGLALYLFAIMVVGWPLIRSFSPRILGRIVEFSLLRIGAGLLMVGVIVLGVLRLSRDVGM